MSETQATQTTTTGGETTTTTGGGDWRASLPAEYQNHAAIKDYKDPGALVKSHIELQSKFGSRKMQDMDVPADEAGREAVFAKLGHARPGKPEEYGLKFPDGFKGDEATLKKFSQAAFDARLTQKQAQALMEADLKESAAAKKDANEKMIQAKKDAAERTETHFRKTWGADYDKNKAAAEKAWAEEIPDEKLRGAFEEMGVHLNPVMVEIFSKIGRMKANQEGGTMWAGGSGNGGGAANSVDGLRLERGKIEKQMSDMQGQKNFDATSLSWRGLLQQRQDILTKEGQAALAKQPGAR